MLDLTQSFPTKSRAEGVRRVWTAMEQESAVLRTVKSECLLEGTFVWGTGSCLARPFVVKDVENYSGRAAEKPVALAEVLIRMVDSFGQKSNNSELQKHLKAVE